MNRLVLPVSILVVVLGSGLATTGCRERQPTAKPHATRATREQTEAEALRALARNPEEIQRRVERADIEVPGTESRVHLQDGRGAGPGTPPEWNVELRKVAGVVPGEKGLDVFVDLAVHRSLKAPDCYLALLHLDSIEAVYTSATLLGEGARVVIVEPENVQGDVYDLKVEYLGRAPEGDFLSSPSERKRTVLKVAHHVLGGTVHPPVTPHGLGR